MKAIAPDGTCFFANVNIPGGSSEWTAAQPIIEQLRNKSLFIDGAVLIGDSLYRVKKAADVLLAVPKVREAVRKKRRECVCVCVRERERGTNGGPFDFPFSFSPPQTFAG